VYPIGAPYKNPVPPLKVLIVVFPPLLPPFFLIGELNGEEFPRGPFKSGAQWGPK